MPEAKTAFSSSFVNNVPVSVAVERVQYLDENGRLITESLTDYTRKTVRTAHDTLNEFLTVWNNAEKKQAVLEGLAAKGVFLDELAASRWGAITTPLISSAMWPLLLSRSPAGNAPTR